MSTRPNFWFILYMFLCVAVPLFLPPCCLSLQESTLQCHPLQPQNQGKAKHTSLKRPLRRREKIMRKKSKSSQRDHQVCFINNLYIKLMRCAYLKRFFQLYLPFKCLTFGKELNLIYGREIQSSGRYILINEEKFPLFIEGISNIGKDALLSIRQKETSDPCDRCKEEEEEMFFCLSRVLGSGKQFSDNT